MSQRVGSKQWLIGALVAGAFALLASCSSGGSTTSAGGAGSTGGASTKKVDGFSCVAASECAGRLCEEGQCSTACESNDDCHARFDTCGVVETGRRCMQPCSASPPLSKITCIDGIPTACNVAGEGHCKDCGCPSSLRCVADQCTAKAALGEACALDSDCKSDNCSSFAGVCRQPVGSQCTSANCDICITTPRSSYCSRECSFDAECGAGACLGHGDFYYCHLPCSQNADSACPGTCARTSGFSLGTTVEYCDCDSGRGCTLSEDRHPLGAPCRTDDICLSGHCDLAATGTDPNYGTSHEGICSKPCEGSSDCGDGFSCAAVGTAHCLPRCDSHCAVGACLELPTTEGDESKVCWVKHAVGGFCVNASDCQGGNCIKGVCAAAGPQSNGSPCAANGDCVSNACQSGTCRGQGLQGDPCKIPADCSVGTCCTTGAQANTCALSCD